MRTFPCLHLNRVTGGNSHYSDTCIYLPEQSEANRHRIYHVCESGTNPAYDARSGKPCYHRIVYDSEVIDSAGTIQAGDAGGVYYSGGSPSYTLPGIQNASDIEQNCTSSPGLNYLYYDGYVE